MAYPMVILTWERTIVRDSFMKRPSPNLGLVKKSSQITGHKNTDQCTEWNHCSLTQYLHLRFVPEELTTFSRTELLIFSTTKLWPTMKGVKHWIFGMVIWHSIHTAMWAGCVQTKWRVRHKITVQAGIMYVLRKETTQALSTSIKLKINAVCWLAIWTNPFPS